LAESIPEGLQRRSRAAGLFLQTFRAPARQISETRFSRPDLVERTLDMRSFARTILPLLCAAGMLTGLTATALATDAMTLADAQNTATAEQTFVLLDFYSDT